MSSYKVYNFLAFAWVVFAMVALIGSELKLSLGMIVVSIVYRVAAMAAANNERHD